MNDITREIKNYILFLKKDLRLEITIHPIGDEQLISGSELALFNIHENPHCIYVKTFPCAFAHCIERKRKIVEKCRDGSFCGTCYAGVREYVYPLYDKDALAGFVCVSGYRDKAYLSYIHRCSQKFSIPENELQKTALSLKEHMPEKAYVDTLITPLIRMLQLAYISCSGTNEPYDTVEKVVLYVNQHYSENITLERICDVFSVSRSSVSHMFKKKTGKVFREYLTDVRLRSARFLLLNSSLNISEIAYSVGFNDSNYFSNTFKSCVGVSPSGYRKSNVLGK